jgi:hypothetical protein
VFGLQWLFVPSYPLYQVVSKASDAHSYIDELATYILGAGAVGEVIILAVAIAFMFFGKEMGIPKEVRQHVNLKPIMKQQLAGFTFAVVMATLSYYIFWWITPLFVTTIIFYFQVYVIMPLAVLGGALLPFIVAANA